MRRDRLQVALLLCTLAVGCSSAPVTTPAPPAAAPAAPATSAALPDDDLWVASSAEYAAIAWEEYVLAGRRIGELAQGHAAGTWAVVLDVDETVLSNVQHEIELARENQDFSDPAWNAWVDRGDAPAIPGVARFCQRVHELGGKVVLVTNREEQKRAPTEANLRREGVPFDLLLLRPDGGSNDKTARWAAVTQGTAAADLPPLEVLMYVGDNIKDFPGGDQAIRRGGEAALQPFGDRFIVIPNPMYGSWKPARSPAAPAPPPPPH
jgi:5'-nucleotidase (lipoprotein e(P4) family)